MKHIQLARCSLLYEHLTAQAKQGNPVLALGHKESVIHLLWAEKRSRDGPRPLGRIGVRELSQPPVLCFTRSVLLPPWGCRIFSEVEMKDQSFSKPVLDFLITPHRSEPPQDALPE